MNLLPAIANLAWAASGGPAWVRFRRALQVPDRTQHRLLTGLLQSNCDCAYGRTHGFSGGWTPAEFARRVPVVEYEDLEPWIARIQGGEQGVLTCEPIQHLIPTSGSTGARKLIPHTHGLECQFNRAISPWIADLYSRHPRAAFGRAYWSITPAVFREEECPSVVPVGFDDDSHYLGGVRKRLVDVGMAVPSELRFVRDMETFRYLTLLCLLRERELRLLSIWHPSFVTLLLDALPGYWDSLLEDIRTGGCRCANALPPQVHAALLLRPMPERARELQAANVQKAETIWPFLSAISCWADGNAGLALAELRRRFPTTYIQPKGLLATEAFVTIPFQGQHPVAVRSHFFEFIDESGRIWLTHELRLDETYDVVVTTAGGLWRYRLGDSVRVTGFVDATPSLRFLGKSSAVSDRFGEKLSEAFVAQVITELTAASPARPGFAMLAPEAEGADWRYTLYVEGCVAPDFAGRLDAELRRNPHYDWCRELGQLKAPSVFEVQSGAYEAFVAREMAQGRRLGEIKTSALSLRDGWTGCFKGATVVAASNHSATTR